MHFSSQNYCLSYKISTNISTKKKHQTKVENFKLFTVQNFILIFTFLCERNTTRILFITNSVKKFNKLWHVLISSVNLLLWVYTVGVPSVEAIWISNSKINNFNNFKSRLRGQHDLQFKKLIFYWKSPMFDMCRVAIWQPYLIWRFQNDSFQFQ
jgi:hypothetical protein